MPSDDWHAYLLEAEQDYYVAIDALRELGSTDYAIIHTVPAAKERVHRAKARYQERLTAYIAFREARRGAR
jgi:hypothetical protein